MMSLATGAHHVRIRVSATALAAAAGHEVHAARWDGGPPDAPLAVALHGLGGSRLNWAAVAPHLLAQGACRSLWAPDLAGFGDTPLGLRSSSVGANAALAAGFVRTVAPGEPVLLLGNSMGGLVALRVASAHLELVDRLVLIAPASPTPIGSPLDPLVAAQFAALLVPGIGERYVRRRVRRLTPRQQTLATMKLCAAEPGGLDPGIIAAHVALNHRRRAQPHAQRAFLEAARSVVAAIVGPGRWSYSGMAAAVTAPTLVLQGERDRLVGMSATAALTARRPQWTLRRYSDLGHVPMLEEPALIARDVAQWLAAQAGATDPAGTVAGGRRAARAS